MKTYRFKKLDAFASGGSTGNPAGAVYLDAPDEISSGDMQRIAREMKGFVSEVGYIWRVDGTAFGLKFYSSEREVEFCGHATIAIMHDIIANDQDLREAGSINIVTSKGRLAVENRIKSEDAVFITAPVPAFSSRKVERGGVIGAFHVNAGELSDEYPMRIVNAGLETLIVAFRSLGTVLSLRPSLEELKAFCVEQGVDIIAVFCGETADRGNSYRTRVFAPTYGYLEDPATGSGNAALGYYLIKNGYWDGIPMRIEQNASRDNPNIVRLATRRDESGELRVLFGGNAVVKIRGEYVLMLRREWARS